MNFTELGLHEAVLKALADAGYSEPTPVQAQAIPAALEGKDLIVSSQTGSGKTAAFMLPAIHRFASVERPAPSRTPNQERQSARTRGERVRYQAAQPRMLVLAPTRELAQQVTDATDKYGAHVRRLRCVSILGGMPYPKQLQLLSRNPEILVATPGRLIDHLNSGKIDLSQIEMLVLDEADRMLDMGFIEDIETIVAATPVSRQTMLFSATLEGNVATLVTKMMRDPVTIRMATSQTRHENIEQRIHFVDDVAHKNRLLDHLLRDAAMGQAVVFTATKRDADLIADQLCDAGFPAAALHGDMQQRARNRTLKDLRHGNVRILVATDVAARGIDVPGITHVFNYDLPKFAEDYVHRIGRTGRAGRSGIAVSLVHHSDGFHVKRIERFTKQSIPVDVVPGHEPQRAPAPRRKPDGWKPGQGRKTHGGDRPARSAGEWRGNGESRGNQEFRGHSQGNGEWRGNKPAGPRREGFGGQGGQRRERAVYPRDENGDVNGNAAPTIVRDGRPGGGFQRDGKPAGFPREGKPGGFSRDGKPGFSREGKSGGFSRDGKPAFVREGQSPRRDDAQPRREWSAERPPRSEGGFAKPGRPAGKPRFDR